MSNQQTDRPDVVASIIDEYAHDQVRIRAGILVMEAGLPPRVREDVRQDMYLELVKAQKRFDPSRGSPHTFVSRVLDRFCMHFVRQRAWEMRKGVPQQPCADLGEEFDLDDNAVGDGALADMVRAEWVERIRELVAGLPEEQRRICEVLISPRSREGMAEELGMSRSTLYRRTIELRAVFLGAGIGEFPESDDTRSPNPQK